MIKNIFAKYWVQFLIGTLWFIILYIGGLLSIEPKWMRLLLFPILGLPHGFFYLLEVKYEGLEISIGKYAFLVFIAGPGLNILAGIPIMGTVFYVFMK